MSVIRNPRSDESFENPNLNCSICNRVNSYLYILNQRHIPDDDEIDESSLFICKSCLTHMIKEIDEAIIEDIKNND